MDGDRLNESLTAQGRCKPTGGKLVCNGHWDHYGTYAVWTRHFGRLGVAHKIVPYDHPAPEVIDKERPR